MIATYQVIARRWRPTQFDDIVGQEHIVRTLKNAITTNRIAHAYLFVGPRGTGKTSTARVFASALNAEGGPSILPKYSAISKAILSGSCIDVIEIDGASNNSVEDIRNLREECQYAPYQGYFKIYIIDEVHMLSPNACNALLKTLEEPPGHVIFIFATTDAHKVLPTILSRCQRFEFSPIRNDKIINSLKKIVLTEEISVNDAALDSIARMADGSMRDAQLILDQLISFCGTTIVEQDVLDAYRLASTEDIKAIVRAMTTVDYKSLFTHIEEFSKKGCDFYRILQDIQVLIREVLLESVKSGGKSYISDVSVSAYSLTKMLDCIHKGKESVRSCLSQRVNFEMTLLRAIYQGIDCMSNFQI